MESGEEGSGELHGSVSATSLASSDEFVDRSPQQKAHTANFMLSSSISAPNGLNLLGGAQRSSSTTQSGCEAHIPNSDERHGPSCSLCRSVSLTRDFAVPPPVRPADSLDLPEGYILGRIDINVDDIGVISVFDMKCTSPSWTAMCPNRPIFVAVFEASHALNEKSVGFVVAFRPLFIRGRDISSLEKRLPPEIVEAVQDNSLESIDAVPPFVFRDDTGHQRFAPKDLVTWPRSWLRRGRPRNPTISDIENDRSSETETIALLSMDHPDAERYAGTVIAIDVQKLGSKCVPSSTAVPALPWAQEVDKDASPKKLAEAAISPATYSSEFIQGQYYLGVVYSVYMANGYGFLKVLDSFGPNPPLFESPDGSSSSTSAGSNRTLFTDHPFRPLAQGLEVYFRLQNISNGNEMGGNRAEVPNRGDLVLFTAHWHSNSRPQARRIQVLAKHLGSSCTGVIVAMTAKLSILLPCEPLFIIRGDDSKRLYKKGGEAATTRRSGGENGDKLQIAAPELALRNEPVFIRCSSGAKNVCHCMGEAIAVVIDPDITTCLRGRAVKALEVKPPVGFDGRNGGRKGSAGPSSPVPSKNSLPGIGGFTPTSPSRGVSKRMYYASGENSRSTSDLWD